MAAEKTLEEIWAALKSADATGAGEILKDSTVLQLASRVHGGTLVHLAAAAGRRELVAELVKAGAELDARDRYGWTPLRAAFQADLAIQGMSDFSTDDNFDRTRSVLEAGGDPNVADQDGKTIWNLASSHGPVMMQRLHEAIAGCDTKVGKRLRGTEGTAGTAFWISPSDTVDVKGFGVTAFSIDEAIRMVRSFKYELSEDQQSLTIVKGITAADITDPAVRKRMGPTGVRGMWFPFIWLGLPPWMKA